ncbi:hypothetical protein X975_06560, partial [Stegodyphus mimosarum]
MPVLSKPRVRLLQDFLVPHLDNQTFPDKLYWINRNKGIFGIFWRHQSSSKFIADDSAVFKEWAILKQLWNPRDEKALTKAKQRLRAALLKLKSVRCLSRGNEHRIYQILSYEDSHNSESDERSSPESNHLWNSLEMSLEELQTELFIDQLLNSNFNINETGTNDLGWCI